MRKFLVFVLLLGILCSLSVGASAATTAKNVSAYATVSHDGTCQVTLTANLHLDQAVEDLRFPLPEKASNITVNGARARSRLEKGLRQVNLSGVVGKAAGDFTLTFTYNLPNLISRNEADQLELHLPLLAGFAYPVQALEFSVTLPGTVTAKPAFSSGYHQANIEKDIYCTTSGATITGTAQTELKDHETLSMSLLVTEEMFPQPRIITPDFQTVNTLILVFAGLALLYWVLFLRNLPAWPARRPTAPEGYNAGQLCSLLHLQGGDMNMMVFSWAQLGYLQIHLQPGGKVQLTRQMDMGNERSAYEQRCFQLLFGRWNTVDASSLRYAQIYQNVQKIKPNVASLVHPKSGNLLVFRSLAGGAGLFGGVAIAIALSSGAVLQWLLVILLGALALHCSFYIQSWAVNLLVPYRRKLQIALALCGGWLLLGAAAGVFSLALGMVFLQLFAGLLAALGGRRTPSGRQLMGEVIGLRRYLRSLSQEQLRQTAQSDPDYFHRMMPYAMALGVQKTFAKRFGNLSIGQCPYISTGADSTMRATGWCGLMLRVYRAMNTRTENPYVKQTIRFLDSFLR